MASYSWNNPFSALGNVASGVADNAKIVNSFVRTLNNDYSTPVNESLGVTDTPSQTPQNNAPQNETPPTNDQFGGYDSAASQSRAIAQANLGDYLRRVDTAESQGLTGINDDYNKKVSDTNLDYGRAMEKFGMQRADTEAGRTSAIGKVDTNARTLANSVQRLLGMASGSGSSAYKLAAPNAIARDTSSKRGEVMSNYGQNFRDLAYAEDNAKTDFERMLADLDAEKKTRERNFLGDIGAERQQAYADAGDNFNADRVQGELDSLFTKYRTPYQVTPVNVNTPQLRDYTTDRTAVQANQTQGQDVYSPYQPLRKKFENQVA